MKSSKVFKVPYCIILIFLFSLFFLWIFRQISARQIDDIHPDIICEEGVIEKSDTLFVIPIYNNVSIAENKTWCNQIINLNKTLGMHGVYHTYQEFNERRNEEYVKLGMEEFKKCFGYYPKIFRAPQLELYKRNKLIINNLGMKISGFNEFIFHKVYHCRTDGEYTIRIIGDVVLTNKFIDII